MGFFLWRNEMVVRLIDESEIEVKPKTQIEETIEMYCSSIFTVLSDLNKTLSTPIKFDEATGAPIFEKTKKGFAHLSYNKIISRPIYVDDETVFRIGYAGSYGVNKNDIGRLAFFDEDKREIYYPGASNNEITKKTIEVLKSWITDDDKMTDFVTYYTETFLEEL